MCNALNKRQHLFRAISRYAASSRHCCGYACPVVHQSHETATLLSAAFESSAMQWHSLSPHNYGSRQFIGGA